MSQEHLYIEEIDAYLQGKLNPKEMAVFEQKLNSDSDFAEAFYNQKLLSELIKENARLELKAYLNTHAKTKVVSSSNWLQSKIFAVAATLIILIGAFIVFQYYSSPKLEETLAIETSLPSPETKREEPNIERPDANIAEIPEIYAEKERAEIPPPTIEELESKELERVEDAAPPSIESRAESMKDDAELDYKIAQEIKNKDTILYAVALTMLDADGSSNSYGTVKTTAKSKSAQFPAAASNSNQAKALEDTKKFVDTSSGKKAKLSKPVATKTKYTVEYWTSPVNFKGYRLTNTTLQLYGLNSYTCRLFTVNGNLYLRNQGKVYVLSPCVDACAYKLEVDPDIIQFILNQN